MVPIYPWQVLKLLVDSAISNGISYQELPRSLAIFERIIRKRGLTSTELEGFMAALEKASGRSDLPILLAKTFMPETLDDYLTLAYTASNLKEAIHLLSRYKWLLHPAVELTVREQGDTAIVCYQTTDGFPLPDKYFYAEGLFSCIYHRTRDVTDIDFQPRKIHFRHGRTPHHERYHDYFGCPVYHDMDLDALHLDRAMLYAPFKSHDPELNRHLQIQAESRCRPTQSFIAQVTDTLSEHLQNESYGIEQLARALVISPRSLQRRLRQHGLTFSELRNNQRIVKAQQALQEPATSVDELATQLGFLNAHSFRQFFKKHTGMTINEFRNQGLDGPGPTDRYTTCSKASSPLSQMPGRILN